MMTRRNFIVGLLGAAGAVALAVRPGRRTKEVRQTRTWVRVMPDGDVVEFDNLDAAFAYAGTTSTKCQKKCQMWWRRELGA
jgi:hypothetical protein